MKQCQSQNVKGQVTVTLKGFAENANVMQGTDCISLSDDLKVRGGV